MRLLLITSAEINGYLNSSKLLFSAGEGRGGKQDVVQELMQWRQKLLYTKHKQPWQTGTLRLWVPSSPLSQWAVTHGRRISLPFWLASWERSRKRGRFWSRAFSHCLRLSVRILVIDGGGGTIQHLFFFFFLFPPPHDTPPVFLGAGMTQTLASKFFWRASLYCHYAMASVIPKQAKKQKKTKQFIVFINGCHGQKLTHDVKEEAGGSLEWIDRSSHADQTEEIRMWGTL